MVPASSEEIARAIEEAQNRMKAAHLTDSSSSVCKQYSKFSLLSYRREDDNYEYHQDCLCVYSIQLSHFVILYR